MLPMLIRRRYKEDSVSIDNVHIKKFVYIILCYPWQFFLNFGVIENTIFAVRWATFSFQLLCDRDHRLNVYQTYNGPKVISVIKFD